MSKTVNTQSTSQAFQELLRSVHDWTQSFGNFSEGRILLKEQKTGQLMEKSQIEESQTETKRNLKKKSNERYVQDYLKLSEDPEIGRSAWRMLVENTSDHQILSLLPLISTKHRKRIAFFALATGRLLLIKKWWRKSRQVQFITESDWLSVVSVLVLYQRRSKTIQGYLPDDKNRTRAFEVFKILLSSHHLLNICRQQLRYISTAKKWRTHHNVVVNLGNCQLVYFLTEMAAGIPHGVTYLVKTWQNINYRIDRVWNYCLHQRHEFDETTLRVSRYAKTAEESCYNPFLQTLRYGHPEDLTFFWHHPEIWKVPCNRTLYLGYNTHVMCYPLGMTCLNANLKMLKRFVSWFIEVKQGLAHAELELSSQIQDKIWSYCNLDQYFGSEQVSNAIKMLRHNHSKNKGDEYTQTDKLEIWKTRFFQPRTNVLKKHFPSLDLDYRETCQPLATYQSGLVTQVPVHPTPEQLLVLANSHMFYWTTKPDGLYFNDRLDKLTDTNHKLLPGQKSKQIYPDPPFGKVKAEKLVIDLPYNQSDYHKGKEKNRQITLYLVFDLCLEEIGTWPERVALLQEIHPFARTFHSLGEENEALGQFLTKIDQDPAFAEITTIWWPKAVYQTTDYHHLLRLMDRPPVTPYYPNDGWILTVPSGKLYKIKPYEQLTLDLKYPLDPKIRSLPENIRKAVIINDCDQSKVGTTVWKYQWNRLTESWTPLIERPDKAYGNKTEIIVNLTRQQLNPWYPSGLISLLKNNHLHPYYNPVQEAHYWSKSMRKHTAEMFKNFKEARKAMINFKRDVFDWDGYNSVNLGCGYQSESKIQIDFDPHVIVHNSKRLRRDDLAYWADGATFRNPLTNEKYDPDQEKWPKNLVSWNSLHYFLDTLVRQESFFQNIAYFNKLAISIIDGDRFETEYVYPDGSYIRKLDNQNSQDYPKAERLLKWQSSQPQIETILGAKEITALFAKYGWQKELHHEDLNALTFMSFKK